MFQDVTHYIQNCSQCQTAKGDYTDPNTMLDVIIANNQIDLVCVNFTKVDHS